MNSKADKVAAILKKEISQIVQFELKDPKIGFITITDVVVTKDLSQAKVYVSFLGQKLRKDAGMKALQKGKGFIRTSLSKRLSLRKTPDLLFYHDTSLENGNRIEKIIHQIQSNEL